MTFKLRIAPFAAGLLFAAFAVHAAPAAPKAPAAWLQSASDIPTDPDVRFGVLPNGMRYAIQRNATPTGQVALRLRFDVGSLMENGSEQGIAHFLEHMAFEGSKNVPEGEMIKILQRHGLAFGADTNAQTGWTQTLYQLDLPTNDADAIDTGLMLLRESASELLIAPNAIDRERGVVLSEERLRDTPALHVFKQGLGFFLQGQLAASRLPIGQVGVIQHADHALIAGFYDKYYRPNRAVLVVVGDFDPAAMEARIKARFSDWSPRGPEGPEPDLGSPEQRGSDAKLVVEAGSSLQIQLEWVKPADRSLDTKAKRRRKTIEQLGLAVLNRRLERIARSDDPPFIAAAASKEDELHSAEATVLAASGKPDRWRPALTAIDQEERRLVQFGVSQAELDREITEVRVQLQAALAQAATRKSTAIAGEIAGTIDDQEVYTPPAVDLALFESVARTLTAAEVSSALPGMFTGDGPLVFMSSPLPVDGGQAALAQAYATSRAIPVTAAAAVQLKAWPYADFGRPGKVAASRTLADLQTSFVRFANGVRLTVKPTKLRDNQVLVRVRIGHGLLDLPKDHETPAWAARAGAFTEGGLKAITAEDMERVLAANIFGAEFAAGEDAFVLQGATRPEDLAVQLQVLAAYASVPAFRGEAFERVKGYMATLHDQMAATPSGVLSRDLNRLMHGGDPRFAFPDDAQIASSTPEAFKAALAGPLATGQIEVLIVGDIPLDKAIATTAATFGALPPRPPAAAPSDARAVALPVPSPQPVELSHKGRSDQAVAYAEWPADDFFSDPQRARTLRVLAQVIENRLTDGLRETQGATYSPQAGAVASLVFPRYGYVSSVVEIPPGRVDDFYRELTRIAADLRTKDVTADELQRARKPLIESLEKSRQTNEYWLEQLSGVQDEPRKIDALRTVVQSLSRVDAAMIREAATLYLRDDRLWELTIVPQPAAAKP